MAARHTPAQIAEAMDDSTVLFEEPGYNDPAQAYPELDKLYEQVKNEYRAAWKTIIEYRKFLSTGGKDMDQAFHQHLLEATNDVVKGFNDLAERLQHLKPERAVQKQQAKRQPPPLPQQPEKVWSNLDKTPSQRSGVIPPVRVA